jgi:hypothetical protein
MSSTVIDFRPKNTTRQDSQEKMIRHYCKELGLDFNLECFRRFHKTYDQLSDEQRRQWLKLLGTRSVEKRERARR